jgi:uncharacterized protein (DUF952 family)
MRKPIFHLASEADLRRDAMTYRPDSLVRDGFIHCAEAEQIMGVAQRYFLGRRDVVLLRIDPAKISAEIRYENLSAGHELFPHIYGALNTDAITIIEPMRMSESNDAFELPACLE